MEVIRAARSRADRERMAELEAFYGDKYFRTPCETFVRGCDVTFLYGHELARARDALEGCGVVAALALGKTNLVGPPARRECGLFLAVVHARTVEVKHRDPAAPRTLRVKYDEPELEWVVDTNQGGRAHRGFATAVTALAMAEGFRLALGKGKVDA